MDGRGPRAELLACAQSGKPDKCNCKRQRVVLLLAGVAAPEAVYLCPSVAVVLLPHGQASLIQVGHVFVARLLDQASLMQLVYFHFFDLRALGSFLKHAQRSGTQNMGEEDN